MEDNIEKSWRTSSYTGNGGGNCVETASGHGVIMVRDTKDRDSGTLAFTAEDWKRFTASVRRGKRFTRIVEVDHGRQGNQPANG